MDDDVKAGIPCLSEGSLKFSRINIREWFAAVQVRDTSGVHGRCYARKVAKTWSMAAVIVIRYPKEPRRAEVVNEPRANERRMSNIACVPWMVS